MIRQPITVANPWPGSRLELPRSCWWYPTFVESGYLNWWYD